MLFCLLFEDLFTQDYFGTIARSPMVFVSPLIFIFLIIYERKIHFTTLPRYYFFYALITLITAFVMLLYTIVFVTNGEMHVYNEFMPVKIIKTAFYNITYFFTVYVLITLCKKVSLETVYNLVKQTLYFLFIVALIQLFASKIPLVNSGNANVSSIFLTASEPSVTAALFITFVLTVVGLRLFLKKGTWGTVIILVISFLILIEIGSKGAVLTLPLAFVVAIRKKLNWKIALLSIVVIVPIAILIVKQVFPALSRDIENFNSVSTRATTWYAAIESTIRFPFGEGYGTYLVYYPAMLLPASHSITTLTGIPLLTGEIVEMVQTGQNITAKSGVASEMVNNGVFALIFLGVLCSRYRRLQKKVTIYSSYVIFSMLGVFLFFIFLFTTAIETAYFYLIPFVVLTKIADQVKMPAR